MTIRPLPLEKSNEHFSKEYLLNAKVHLSYRDILLIPYDDNFCGVRSRNDPDISSEVCPKKRLRIPLISAPMDSVTTGPMVEALDSIGALGIHTRWIGDDSSAQLSAMKRLKPKLSGYLSCAIGVRGAVYETATLLADVGVDIICLDIANGNHVFMRDAISEVCSVKAHYPISIIAGNVATGKSAVRLAECGADAVKVGIGPGGACTTRRVTGFGVPQFTALLDCAHARKESGLDFRLIADGGCRHPGDVVKALWAGADSVMAGYIFAGHDECPQFEGKRQYRGMSSRTVSGRSDVAPEGVCFDVESRGTVTKTVEEYAAAIRAACSMGNAWNLHELRQNVKAIRVSTMTHEESDPVED